MKKFFSKVITLCELLLGFGLIILALEGVLPLFIFNALLGVAGFFIILDGLEHIDDPVTPQSSTPPSEDKKEGD